MVAGCSPARRASALGLSGPSRVMRSRHSRSVALRSRRARTLWLSRDSWTLRSRSDSLIARFSRPRCGAGRDRQDVLIPYDMISVLYELRNQCTEKAGEPMKLTIFGATGATGTCLTEQALAAGHEVTAVVRDPARLSVPAHPGCGSSPPTSWTPPRSARPVAGADAVLAAFGPARHRPHHPPREDSVRSIIQAMHKDGTRRLLRSAAPSSPTRAKAPYLRYLVKPLARRTFLRHVSPTCAAARTRSGTATWTGRSSARPR